MSDHERLEALFAEHAGAVQAYALRRADAATADDVVSEVFVVACRRLGDVPSDDALPWLLGCARRVLANQQRGGRRRAALSRRLESGAPVEDVHEHPPVVVPSPDGVLARALAQISDRDRELLMLIAWEELDPARAARVLGCSRGALAVRLHRARRRLADALAREQASRASCIPTVEVDP